MNAPRTHTPSAQLSLPGLDIAPAWFSPEIVPARGRTLQGYKLFLAILPDAADANRLARAAQVFRNLHGLNGSPLPSERLHITLHTIANFTDKIPKTVVDAAVAASNRVVCARLPIVFDHVLTFAESNALVLRCDCASDAAVGQLRRSLTSALRSARLHPEPSRTPHMTVLYDRSPVPSRPLEPICWTATRFALILSHVGIRHHQSVAEWALRAPD